MARSFFYYGGIKKSIISFLDVFNDIHIAKFNSSGTATKYVEVPIKFMPKQKWYEWMNDLKHEKRYPMIGAELNGIEYDPERVAGAQERINISVGEESISYTPNPIPYNLTFTLSIATEHQNEQDQINEQLLPFFAPYVYTKINVPELNISWDMHIVFDGASIETEIDIPEDDYKSVIWRHNYTAKTYLLKPSDSIANIRKIVHKFYMSEESWNNINSLTDSLSGEGTQSEELLIIGSKVDDEIMKKYLAF